VMRPGESRITEFFVVNFEVIIYETKHGVSKM
jgi:hypothetical protein